VGNKEYGDEDDQDENIEMYQEDKGEFLEDPEVKEQER
jgi:hypothetical protein